VAHVLHGYARVRVLPLILLSLSACEIAVPIGSRHWDPISVAEEGPLELEHRVAGGKASAFRIEAYQGTVLSLDASGVRGHLWVEGPLDGMDDPTAIGALPIIAETRGSRLHLELKLNRGVYRVVTGTEAGSPGITLSASCKAECVRRDLPLRTLLLKLSRDGRLAPVIEALRAQLATLIPDETARRALEIDLLRMSISPDLQGIERFPTVSLHALGPMREVIGHLPVRAPEHGRVIDGDFLSLLGACDLAREAPPPVHPLVPEVGSGHFHDGELTRCQAAQSQRLAQILTSLAEGDSHVRYRGADVKSPVELITELMQSGHTVEVRNERTYTNFLPLTYGDYDVRWPVWIDTGLTIGGSPISVPMGHSHHAWRIRGPHVNARVMFMIDRSGAAFFPQLERRPAWTGQRTRDSGRSDLEGGARILATFEAAALYLRHTRAEQAAGLQHLGTANDSNAALELITRGTITTWPLLRSSMHDVQYAQNDGLDNILRALPKDADRVTPSDGRMDTLRRLVEMSPLDANSPNHPDDRLKLQLQAITEEVLSY
jgi:hypothetical protein